MIQLFKLCLRVMVPSDCEQDEHETNKNRTTEGDMDTSTEEFLVDF